MSFANNIILIVLLATSVLRMQLGSSEKVKLKVSLNRQPDGHVHAYMFIGNATKKIMSNLSLHLDLDAIMDNSEKLIGVQGFVRDSKRINTLEHYTCTSKDEQINALWSILCPEKGEELLKIVMRTEWGGKENLSRERRLKTADLLIVNGRGYDYDANNYYEWMRELDNYQTKYFGDIFYNFYISDDGNVFEGVGWNRFNYIFNGGLGPRSLTIAFIKEKRHAIPSTAAIKAFNELVKSAICKKELSVNYSLIPYYLIWDTHSLGNDTFERKEMRTWNSYKENLDFLFPRERVESIVPQIIPKENWRISKLKGELMTLSSPIEYIVISQWWARCFFNCTNYLNVVERYHDKKSETIYFNFLLSEEGRVYEVMGWEETWNKEFQNTKVLDVGFLGKFNSYSPIKPMFLALDALIRDGLRSGKLSPHYKILSMRRLYPSLSNFMEDFLGNEIRKLDRYTDKY